jgi:DNA-binding MarR family transcriptional regulator
MAGRWTFLTNHAQVLLCIAGDPAIRLRDIAARLGITERAAYGIVIDLADAGYLVKEKNGRRNHYEIQAHLRLPEPTSRERTVGELLAVLVGDESEGPPAQGVDTPAAEHDSL